MFSEASRMMMKRIGFRSYQIGRWMWKENARNMKSIRDFFFDMTNDGVFQLFDWADALRKRNSYRRFRGLLFVCLFGGVGYYLADLYRKVEIFTARLSVCNKDEEFISVASAFLDDVTIRFVLENDFVRKMLGEILVSNVFENSRITFMLARTLGRVISQDFIKNNLTELTIHNVLSENVLPNEDIYKEIKAQIVLQLRNPMFQDLIKDQMINFMGSETCLKLAQDGLFDVLLLKPVINAFVTGVVDDTIYPMLESKEMARKLDNQIYEVLK